MAEIIHEYQTISNLNMVAAGDGPVNGINMTVDRIRRTRNQRSFIHAHGAGDRDVLRVIIWRIGQINYNYYTNRTRITAA